MSFAIYRSRFGFVLVFVISFLCGLSPTGLAAQGAGEFSILSNFRNIGLILSSVVGPGPGPGSQRLYASIGYSGGTFDILAIDPETGGTIVVHSPVSGETGVWDMVAGPDGNIYMGTAPNAHLLKLDTGTGVMTDLGIPSRGEEYVWAVAIGSDHRLYGGTYPGCRLVRYDPATGEARDLGRLDPTQQYARYLTGTSDGFIYAGIGSAAAKVVAYQISTGVMKEILPEEAQVAGFAHTYAGDDGSVYGLTPMFDYRISGWQATEIPGADVPDEDGLKLADGRALTLDEEGGVLVLRVRSGALDTGKAFKLNYAGEPNQLFRVGFGPDGMLYGSGSLPSDLVRIHANGNFDYIGSLGNGEAYSMLPVGSNLVFGTYADLATLILFNPSQPFSTDTGASNPQLIATPDVDICWRPEAMVEGLDGLVYVGAQAAYGELGGPMVTWNPVDGTVRHFSVVPKQSVVSLAVWNSQIVGGTTITGGPGSTPVATDAQLFLWDTKEQAMAWTAVPVPGAHTITDLVAAPNGLVYGFADSTLFEFDPSHEMVLRTEHTSVSNLIYNSIGVDTMGRIWGLSSEGVFTIDTVHLQVRLVAAPPVPITGGFALSGGNLYFIAGTAVYGYGLPLQGFALGNDSTNASVTAGNSAEFNLTVTAVGDFKGTVTFSCGGLPAGVSCSFSPSSVASAGSSHLTISTAGPVTTAEMRSSRGSLFGLAGPGLCAVLAGVFVRRRQWAAMLLVLVVMAAGMSGCGTHLTAGSSRVQTAATPAGTYAITVRATGSADGSSMTQTMQIALTVH